jgi:hypothetical protein
MSGDVIERGHAMFVSGNEYVYKIVTSELTDVVVKVEVTDRPGVVVVAETPVENRPRSVHKHVQPAEESRLMQAPYTVRSFSFFGISGGSVNSNKKAEKLDHLLQITDYRSQLTDYRFTDYRYLVPFTTADLS